MTTVKDLRRIAEKILEQIEGWDDDEEISTSSNTYGMAYSILETRGGFVDYYDIRLESDEDEEDYEDDEDW